METATLSILARENYDSILAWLSGRNPDQPEVAEPFIRALSRAFTERTGTNLFQHAGSGHRLSLNHIMQQARLEEEKRSSAPAASATTTGETAPERHAPAAPRLTDGNLPLPNEDGFQECGTDSADLAQAVIWCHSRLDPQLTKGAPISMNRLQILLYTLYGFYLAQRGARLTAEHPQMWKYGPMFPRVFNKFKDIPVSGTAFERFQKEDPALAEFIERTVRRSFDTPVKNAYKEHMKDSSAYGACRKLNGEQWGAVIPDIEIHKEFTRILKKNK